MNEFTYNICHTPIIGLFVYITNLCVFPNVFEEKIELNRTDVSTNITFEVPVSKEYLLEFVLNHTPKIKTMESASVFIGERLTQPEFCLDRPETEEASINFPKGKGTSTPLEINIIGSATKDHFYVSGSCSWAWGGGGQIGRILTSIYLEKGKYKLIARPTSPVNVPFGTYATIQLSPGRSK